MTSSLPVQLPSFSSSSCPSSRSSHHHGHWRHKEDRPIPPTPPAGRGMSPQQVGTIGSSRCKHSSPQSGDQQRRQCRTDKNEKKGEHQIGDLCLLFIETSRLKIQRAQSQSMLIKAAHSQIYAISLPPALISQTDRARERWWWEGERGNSNNLTGNAPQQ